MKTLLKTMAVLAAFTAASAHAGPYAHYEVTITNITPGQYFTPVLATTHEAGPTLFELGSAPSQALADMAEGGDTSGIAADLYDAAFDMAATDNGLIGPGQSRTVWLAAPRRPGARLSLAGMLLPTNDSFVALNAVELPRTHATMTAVAYDAGSEDNDELCASIPGPMCGGEPFSDGLGEGFVHVSRGIQGAGDLGAADHDWRNPVARITIRKVD
ncbi:hypothetical protein F3N42_08985 [Marinihelvus fidelis]|uniref:Uncharacterized protein n=1 Tax=Marinihelvus fidelis TaxID=2613842 RepID=A0A5N0T922_9GAMM|nr:spondin domain-containing protein [Marinihelvus fidelis]KAA9131442.1 hypothetical protein F3N42_08985 [Marinihelvus fidelis]